MLDPGSVVVGRPRAEDLTGLAVAQLREVASFIDRNAEELVGDMDGSPIAEDGLRFTIEIGYDRLSTVTAHKTFIVLGVCK